MVCRKKTAPTHPRVSWSTFLIYAMVFLTPGDPVLALAGEKAADPDVLDAIRQQYNLDKPFLVQYLLFLGGSSKAISA